MIQQEKVVDNKISAMITKVGILGLLLITGSQITMIGALSSTVMAKDDDEPKPPKTCTFVDKKGGAQAIEKRESWDKERGYFLKFVNESAEIYVGIVKSDDKFNERNWWEQQRELERRVKDKKLYSFLGTLDDTSLEYKNTLREEANKDTYWSYLISLGTAKGYVTGWINDFPNSIDSQIAQTKGWRTGGSGKAESIKSETLKKLEIAKSKLLSLNKQIDTYACPSARNNYSTGWSDEISGKAFKIWNAVDDVVTANFKKVDDIYDPPGTSNFNRRLVWSPEKRVWEECMTRTRHAAFPGRIDPQVQRGICGAPPARTYVPE